MKYPAAILFIFIFYTTATAEKLKMFHNDSVHEHYYDRDSISYPVMKIASNTPDKSIIELWEVRKTVATNYLKRFEKRINCNNRQITTKKIIENGKINYDYRNYNTSMMQPNTADYYLFREVCIYDRYR